MRRDVAAALGTALGAAIIVALVGWLVTFSPSLTEWLLPRA